MKVWFVMVMLIALGISGCGVDTDSSDPASPPSIVPPVDGNDTNSTDPTDPTNPDNPDNPTDPVFDPTDAQYDENSCRSAYATATPLQDNNTNDDRETDDVANGISIQSFYNDTTGDPEETNVIAFYKALPTGVTPGAPEFRENLYGDNGMFLLAYDKVWASVDQNTVYVQTPKDGAELPSCYRVALNSEDSTQLSFTKVYR